MVNKFNRVKFPFLITEIKSYELFTVIARNSTYIYNELKSECKEQHYYYYIKCILLITYFK